jgi:hypothetical protein
VDPHFAAPALQRDRFVPKRAMADTPETSEKQAGYGLKRDVLDCPFLPELFRHGRKPRVPDQAKFFLKKSAIYSFMAQTILTRIYQPFCEGCYVGGFWIHSLPDVIPAGNKNQKHRPPPRSGDQDSAMDFQRFYDIRMDLTAIL